eukprot:gene17230-23553_t
MSVLLEDSVRGFASSCSPAAHSACDYGVAYPSGAVYPVALENVSRKHADLDRVPNVCTAKNRRVALEFLSTPGGGDVDVVLKEHNPPHVNACRFLRSLSQSPSRHIPVIVMGLHRDPEEVMHHGVATKQVCGDEEVQRILGRRSSASDTTSVVDLISSENEGTAAANTSGQPSATKQKYWPKCDMEARGGHAFLPYNEHVASFKRTLSQLDVMPRRSSDMTSASEDLVQPRSTYNYGATSITDNSAVNDPESILQGVHKKARGMADQQATAPCPLPLPSLTQAFTPKEEDGLRGGEKSLSPCHSLARSDVPQDVPPNKTSTAAKAETLNLILKTQLKAQDVTELHVPAAAKGRSKGSLDSYAAKLADDCGGGKGSKDNLAPPCCSGKAPGSEVEKTSLGAEHESAAGGVASRTGVSSAGPTAQPLSGAKLRRGAHPSSGVLRMDGPMQTNEPVQLSGAMQMGHSIQMDGPMQSNGAVQLSGAMQMGHSMQMDGPMQSNGAVQLSGAMQMGHSMQMDGPMQSNGAVQLSGAMQMSHSMQMDGPMQSNGAVQLSGAMQMGHSMQMDGPMQSNGAVQLSGAMQMGHSMQMDGPMQSNGAVQLSGAMQMSHSMQRDGPMQSNGAVQLSGAMQMGHSMQMDGPMQSNGAVQLSGAMQMGHSMQMDGPVQLNGPVQPCGAMQMGHSTQMGGPVQLSGTMQMSQSLQPCGAMQMGHSTQMGGPVQLSGTMQMSQSMQPCGAMQMGHSMQMDGPVQLSGAMQMSQSLQPCGAMQMSGLGPFSCLEEGGQRGGTPEASQLEALKQQLIASQQMKQHQMVQGPVYSQEWNPSGVIPASSMQSVPDPLNWLQNQPCTI